MFVAEVCDAIHSVQQTKSFIGQRLFKNKKIFFLIGFVLFFPRCPRLIQLFRSNYLVDVSERYFFCPEGRVEKF